MVVGVVDEASTRQCNDAVRQERTTGVSMDFQSRVKWPVR
jgi:hypothetical protein